MHRYLCVHGHFYQPPRENPWLGAIEPQVSAHPYRDWNERITAECYAPNAASRILDREGRIARIVNNYTRISFNFGPTLLAWMEERAPEVYASILEADELSRERFAGHGSALAQPYNHLILPLANSRDKRTQVVWGLADFEHLRRDGQGHARIPELLEMQRHAMLMYTSCGWFFNDLAGIETIQVLRYAGRVVQLAERLLGGGFEEGFLSRLERARSNEGESGRELYEQNVRVE